MTNPARHNPYLPPNPRAAKRRIQPSLWAYFPLTVAMVGLSLLVGVVSLLGEDTRYVDWMFLSAHPDKAEVMELREVVAEMQTAPRQERMPDYEAAMQRLQAIASHRLFDEVKHGQVWRLVTPIFLHFGVLHLVFNLMWLWQLGRVLESLYRTLRFGLLVAAIAIGSNVAQGLVAGPNFGGMSGVIYGLFGFVLVHSKLHPAATFQLNPQVVRWMLIWLVLCFTGLVGPVANTAHLVGLAVGALLGGAGALRGGAWGVFQRRQQFHQAVDSARTASLHRCAVCGRTERDADGHLEFRVSRDGEEYCLDHLPSSPPRQPGS